MTSAPYSPAVPCVNSDIWLQWVPNFAVNNNYEQETLQLWKLERNPLVKKNSSCSTQASNKSRDERLNYLHNAIFT